MTRKMSHKPSRLFLKLAERGLTFADLAKTTGYSIGTLWNLANGANRSRIARKEVETFLHARIWPRSGGGFPNPPPLPQNTPPQS